jgi:hypothetical protein
LRQRRKEDVFFEKKAEARPAGTKKLLFLKRGLWALRTQNTKSFLLLFFKKEDLSFFFREAVNVNSGDRPGNHIHPRHRL